MKKLLLQLLLLLFALPAMSQPFVVIQGHVWDSTVSGPIYNHPVSIVSDSSSGFIYFNTVYTDGNGFYNDTVPINGAAVNLLYVRILDCNQVMFQQSITINPSVTVYTADFWICNNNSPCLAGFNTQNGPNLTVHFIDASVGGFGLRFWEFGDGSTSTLLNPVHQYLQPGIYPVTLTIGALGTICYNSTTQMVHVSDSITGPCDADFVSIPDSNSVYSYSFYPQSTWNVSTYTWTFGDGTTQTISFPQNPNVNHTYAQPGTYLVCLTVQGVDSTCFDFSCDTLYVGNTPQCHAAFTYYTDSLTAGNTYHFINQSTGNIVSYEWIFGDPGSGSNNFSNLEHPTHVFSAPGTYNVCLTIHGADSLCIDNICHTIVVGTGPGCQANFSHSIDPVAGNKTVSFSDLSTGNPTAWLWSFGDGTSGTQQNPVHTYAAYGTYNVCLTITADSCTSTFCQLVVVQDSVIYQQVYGQIFAGNFPVTGGLVMIMSFDTTGTYTPYNEVFQIDSNGVYYFTMVPPGNYYILAIPFDSGNYLPTYYGNVINWQQATLVTLGIPANPYNINLLAAGQMTVGPGSASGQINMNRVKSGTMDKINMILKNEQGTAVGFTRVLEDGSFDFSSLAYGTYYLYPEMPGVTSDQVMITLTAEKPHAEVSMTFTGTKITGISDDAGNLTGWSIYPNPVDEVLSLSMEVKQTSGVEIALYTLTGRQVSRMQVSLVAGRNLVTINTSHLQAGMYLIRVTSPEGVIIASKMIKN